MKKALLIFTAGFVLCAASPAQKPAKTVPPREQKMYYDVYAGGIHVVEASLDVGPEKAGRYRIEMRARTRGFLGVLAPWKGSFLSAGWLEKHAALRPEFHQSVSTWRGDVEIKDYRYGRDGSFKSYRAEESGRDKTPKKIDKALTQNSTDAMTATLAVMQALEHDRPCEGASEIFDGDRRYRLIFRDKGEELLEASPYNIYSGPARKCEVEVQPLEGHWSSKPRGWLSIQEQGRKQGALPTVWIAKMPGGGAAVPVRVQVKTNYGTLFSHLTGYDDGRHKTGSAQEERMIEDR